MPILFLALSVPSYGVDNSFRSQMSFNEADEHPWGGEYGSTSNDPNFNTPSLNFYDTGFLTFDIYILINHLRSFTIPVTVIDNEQIEVSTNTQDHSPSESQPNLEIQQKGN